MVVSNMVLVLLCCNRYLSKMISFGFYIFNSLETTNREASHLLRKVAKNMCSLGLLSTYMLYPPPRKNERTSPEKRPVQKEMIFVPTSIFQGNRFVFGPENCFVNFEGINVCSVPVSTMSFAPRSQTFCPFIGTRAWRTDQIDWSHIVIHKSWFIHQPESLILSGLDSGGYTIFGRSGIELIMLGVNGQAINKSLFTLGQAVKGMGCRTYIYIYRERERGNKHFQVKVLVFRPFRYMSLQGWGM